MPGLFNLHIRVGFTMRSPLLPATSMDFNYENPGGIAATTADVMNIAGQLTASFNTTPAGAAHAPSYYMSAAINNGTNACKWEVYDFTTMLTGGKLGSPVAVGAWTCGVLGVGTGLPQQDAIVITLQAPYSTDVEFAPGSRPRARDRGRLYFGPLATSPTINTDTNNRNYVGSGCQVDLGKWIKSINAITSTVTTGVSYQLGVWSRKGGTMKALQECWVDDRYDTQRRRSGGSGGKTITPLP